MRNPTLALFLGLSFIVACSGFTEFTKAVNNTNEAVNTTNEVVNDPLNSNATNTAKNNATNDASNAKLDEPARCCVNKQYYSCDTLAATSECVGEPLDMMNCIQNCSFGSSGCEDSCIRNHGPNPSQCTRQTSRDAECPQ